MYLLIIIFSSLSIYLSLFMSIKQSQSVPACISILFAPCLSVNLFMHIYWPQSVHICQSQFVHFCLSTYFSMFRSVYQSQIFLSISVHSYLPTYLFQSVHVHLTISNVYIYQSRSIHISLFQYVNTYLSISICSCLSIYISEFRSNYRPVSKERNAQKSEYINLLINFTLNVSARPCDWCSNQVMVSLLNADSQRHSYLYKIGNTNKV